MRNKVFYILLVLIFSCTSNNQKDKILNDVIFNLSKNEKLIKQIDAIFLIPMSGCSGCIHNAVHFMRHQIDDYDNLLFIMTNIQSKKMFKVEMGDSIMSYSNFYTDYDDISYELHPVNPYPIIFYLKKGNITKEVNLSPENHEAVIRDLVKYLDKK